MEIELKDLNSGIEKNSSQDPVESCIEEVIKNLVKVALKAEAKVKYKEACRIIKVIISNILANPQEDKYRIIKKNNPKFQNAFGKYEAGANLLEVLGFELVEDNEPMYIYSHLDTSILQQ